MINGEIFGEPITPETIIYPTIIMSSLGEVKLKDSAIPRLNSIIGSPTFSVQFSSFKANEEKKLTHLHFILSQLNPPTIPQIFSSIVDDPNGEQAINFLRRPLLQFQDFRKGILIFEDKAYTLAEFEKVIEEWKDSLKEETNEEEKG